MCVAMGPATLLHIQLYAYLVSPAPRPTFIHWRRHWQPIPPAPDWCWRSNIAVTVSPNTIATATTRFEVALADLSAMLAALEITSATVVGTSFGGVLAMMLAALPPIAVTGVILNDIGPVLEPAGLMRIKSYVGKLPTATSKRVRKFCAGYSRRSSRNSHRTIGLRLPNARGARITVHSCRPMTPSSPERCEYESGTSSDFMGPV